MSAQDLSSQEGAAAQRTKQSQESLQAEAYKRKAKKEDLLIYLSGFWLCASIGFGVYLIIAFFSAPAFSALLTVLTASLAPWVTFSLGIAIGYLFMFTTTWVVTPFSSIAKFLIRPKKLEKYGQSPEGTNYLPIAVKYLTYASNLTGIGFGIYLSTLIIPAAIQVLISAGIPYGFSVFIAITASCMLINATIDLLATPAIALLFVADLKKWRTFLKPKSAIPIPYIMLGAAGTALGLYLSLMGAPLLEGMLLALPGVNTAITIFVVAAAGMALTLLCARVFSSVGALLGSLMDCAICEWNIRKNQALNIECREIGVQIENTFRACLLAIVPEVTTEVSPYVIKPREDAIVPTSRYVIETDEDTIVPTSP